MASMADLVETYETDLTNDVALSGMIPKELGLLLKRALTAKSTCFVETRRACRRTTCIQSQERNMENSNAMTRFW